MESKVFEGAVRSGVKVASNKVIEEWLKNS